MNKVIRDQLSKVKSVNISFDNITENIVLSKIDEILPVVLNVGNIYLIELEDFVINPQSNSTLASNWNAGKVPKYKYYKAEFLEKMGNMYKFNGIAYDHNQDIYSENWFGWFPENGFKVLEKI